MWLVSINITGYMKVVLKAEWHQMRVLSPQTVCLFLGLKKSFNMLVSLCSGLFQIKDSMFFSHLRLSVYCLNYQEALNFKWSPENIHFSPSPLFLIGLLLWLDWILETSEKISKTSQFQLSPFTTICWFYSKINVACKEKNGLKWCKWDHINLLSKQ